MPQQERHSTPFDVELLHEIEQAFLAIENLTYVQVWIPVNSVQIIIEFSCHE